MYKTLSAPIVVQIEITERCTSKCVHCYNFWRHNNESLKNPKDFPLELIDAVIEQLSKYGVFHIVFTGGEPLLNKRVLFRALEKAGNKGITTGINSNLIPLTLNDAIRLKQLQVSGVLTSLMGPNDKIHDELAQHHNAFKKTVRGIRFLQNVGMPVVANMVISQRNKMYLRDTALFVKSLGIKRFSSTRAGCPGNCSDFSGLSLTLQDFKNYLEELYDIGKQESINVGVLESYPLCAIREARRYKSFIDRRCLAGVTTLTIASDGNIRPCSHTDIIYGNVFDEDLAIVWHKMKEWRDGSLLPAICRSCKIFSWCGGGCRMEAKMRNGFLNALDPHIVPQDVEFTAHELGLINHDNVQVLPPAFRLNPRTRWRIEDFGAIVFVGQRLSCYLNKPGINFLKNLDLESIYKLSDFTGQFKENVEKFLNRLYTRQILIS